jgi:hypothetical protein
MKSLVAASVSLVSFVSVFVSPVLAGSVSSGSALQKSVQSEIETVKSAFLADASVQAQISELNQAGYTTAEGTNVAFWSSLCGFVECQTTYFVTNLLSNNPAVNAQTNSVAGFVTLGALSKTAKVTLVDPSVLAGNTVATETIQVDGNQTIEARAKNTFDNSPAVQAEIAKRLGGKTPSELDKTEVIVVEGGCGFSGCGLSGFVIRSVGRGLSAHPQTVVAKFSVTGNLPGQLELLDNN